MRLRVTLPHTLSLSYGKDSCACLGAIEVLGWPLERIVTSEVWATDTIPADPPAMMEFKKRADQTIKERWGITVEHFYAKDKDGSKLTFEKMFYRARTSCKPGHEVRMLYGWPFRKGPWCNDRLKMNSLPDLGVSYLGIAADEPERIARHSVPGTKLPLVEVGWTEADCRKWCEDNDLLSPIYTTATRGGCWFCHNQGVDQLRLLRREYPEYWNLMLKWDRDSPVTFHSDGRTVLDFEYRFCAEDDGYLTNDHRFRWAELDKIVRKYYVCTSDQDTGHMEVPQER